jgi:teichuronic acid biosynthesis glycosyltransferase TuaC
MSLVEEAEVIDGLKVFHPRYFLVPGISMPLHGFLIFVSCFLLVRRLHQQKGFDYIDSHFVYPDGFAAVLLGKALGIRVAVSARGTDINVYPEKPLVRSLIQWTLKNSAKLIAVSGALKARIELLGSVGSKCRVIPNGIDADRFHRKDKLSSKRALGMSETSKVIIAVGSLIEPKGHQLLIAAVANVAQTIPGLRLFILGEGEYRSALTELIREKRLEESVTLVGNKPNEELAAWYSAADLTCLMSSREGWPNALSESLACGTPILATKVGGIPEIVDSNELGLLTERDVPSIVSALKKCLSKNWNNDEIERQGRARSWDAVAAEVLEFLQTGE